MKIGMNNYYQEVNQVGLDKFTPGLKKMHDVIDKLTKGGEDWSMYQMYKDRFEKQFEALEMFIDEQSVKPKTETKPLVELETQPKHSTTQKPVRPYKKPERVKQGGDGRNNNNKPRKKKKNKEVVKSKVKGKGVELISAETTYIKRYTLLHNKTKTKEQILAFIRSLQKAIVERRIRKTSKYAKEIMEIQEDLISKFRKAEKSQKGEASFNHEEKLLNRLYKISGAEIVMPSIRFIKAFVSLQGKEITKHKVSNLHSRLMKAWESEVITPNDKYYNEVRLIFNTLKDYLNEGGKSLDISERQLNGLEGVLNECGCQELKGIEHKENNELENRKENPVVENQNVLTVQEVRSKKFSVVPITDPWLTLLGKFCLPTSFFISGIGGSGKTTWTLLFMQYMASLGFKILYIAKDQIGTPSFTDLLNRLDIVAGDNFKITGELMALNPKNFDFVVIDNKDDLAMKPKDFQELKAKYPDQTFVLLSRATKSGEFTGSGEWRNIVEVMLLADKGVIKVGHDKNRWGGKGEMKVF